MLCKNVFNSQNANGIRCGLTRRFERHIRFNSENYSVISSDCSFFSFNRFLFRPDTCYFQHDKHNTYCKTDTGTTIDDFKQNQRKSPLQTGRASIVIQL